MSDKLKEKDLENVSGGIARFDNKDVLARRRQNAETDIDASVRNQAAAPLFGDATDLDKIKF